MGVHSSSQVDGNAGLTGFENLYALQPRAEDQQEANDDATGGAIGVYYYGYVYTSGTAVSYIPSDADRISWKKQYCDTEEVWRIGNDWCDCGAFATSGSRVPPDRSTLHSICRSRFREVCTYDGLGTFKSSEAEVDGFSGQDCWRAAPDPEGEDDDGTPPASVRRREERERARTHRHRPRGVGTKDWECDARDPRRVRARVQPASPRNSRPPRRCSTTKGLLGQKFSSASSTSVPSRPS